MAKTLELKEDTPVNIDANTLMRAQNGLVWT